MSYHKNANGRTVTDIDTLLEKSNTALQPATDIAAKSLSLNQNISQAAWTTGGVRVKNTVVTLTDTTSAGTVAAAYSNRWGGNTIAALNATTFTEYATHYFDAPVAGANVTITTPYAIIVNGNAKINGTLSGAALKDYAETIYSPAEITASTLTIDLANGNVQRFTINPSGASTEITLPADPGPLCKSFMLLITNGVGKAHTWAASPTSRWVSEASAGTPPTPAAATYVTIYVFVWDDVNGGTGRWLGWCSGRDTA